MKHILFESAAYQLPIFPVVKVVDQNHQQTDSTPSFPLQFAQIGFVLFICLRRKSISN